MRETTYHLPGLFTAKLALLSDLHNRPFQPIISSLRVAAPDLFCIAGDIFYGAKPLREQENVLPFLSACSSIAPTFLSLGNHEQAVTRSEIKKMEKTGVVVLDNEFISTTVAGMEVAIGGLTSGYVTAYRRWKKNHPRQERPEGKLDRQPDVNWLPAFTASPGFHILLSHHPEYYPQLQTFLPDDENWLVCSGHAHGGQIAYYSLFKKRWCGLFAPGQGWWPRWTKGVYDGRLIVSSGLSNTTWVPRLFNPTEIVYITPAIR